MQEHIELKHTKHQYKTKTLHQRKLYNPRAIRIRLHKCKTTRPVLTRPQNNKTEELVNKQEQQRQ